MVKPRERWVTKRVREVACAWCETWFEPTQDHARFCKASCRVMAHRKEKAKKVPK